MLLPVKEGPQITLKTVLTGGSQCPVFCLHLCSELLAMKVYFSISKQGKLKEGG